jgi:hypothetical protein
MQNETIIQLERANARALVHAERLAAERKAAWDWLQLIAEALDIEHEPPKDAVDVNVLARKILGELS